MQPQPPKQETATGFHGLGIAPALLQILARENFETPTPIQTRAIPVALQGKDVVGIAQTGTGKTLAFGIPLFQRLAEVNGRGLVILPTRELALQVDSVLNKMGRSLNIRTAVLIGGAPMGSQMQALRTQPHIIVATPGRLIDHLEQKNVRLDAVRMVVLDEADRMLDMGFMPQIKRIFQTLPKERQTMLFSATMPQEIMRIAAAYMKLPVRVEIATSGTTVERVTQELFIVSKEEKIRLLAKLLETYQGPTLVFTRTKHGAKRMAQQIRALGVNAAEIHSNRSLGQRKEALYGFKTGKYRVLVATDIASRGIDVHGIELVVNYDLPTNSEDYVHRIGRTARAGAPGHAITFAMPDQRKDVRDIERVTHKQIAVSKLPELSGIHIPQIVQPPRQEQRRGQRRAPYQQCQTQQAAPMGRNQPHRRSGFQHRRNRHEDTRGTSGIKGRENRRPQW